MSSSIKTYVASLKKNTPETVLTTQKSLKITRLFATNSSGEFTLSLQDTSISDGKAFAVKFNYTQSIYSRGLLNVAPGETVTITSTENTDIRLEYIEIDIDFIYQDVSEIFSWDSTDISTWNNVDISNWSQ